MARDAAAAIWPCANCGCVAGFVIALYCDHSELQSGSGPVGCKARHCACQQEPPLLFVHCWRLLATVWLFDLTLKVARPPFDRLSGHACAEDGCALRLGSVIHC